MEVWDMTPLKEDQMGSETLREYELYLCPSCSKKYIVFAAANKNMNICTDCELAALRARLAEAEKELAHWRHMYECAQNANAYRQDAIDKFDAARGGKEGG